MLILIKITYIIACISVKCLMAIQLSNTFFKYYLKFLLIGDTNVGKTSLLLSYSGEDTKEELGATIGVDFKHKVINIDEKVVKVQVWDTAGQERFRTLTKSYFKMAQGILLVFDLSNYDTFELLKSWVKEINDNVLEGTVIMLIGNKCDLTRKVQSETASQFAEKNGMKYFETSASRRLNVNEVFNNLCRDVIAIFDKDDNEFIGQRDKSRTIYSNSNYSSGKCCK